MSKAKKNKNDLPLSRVLVGVVTDGQPWAAIVFRDCHPSSGRGGLDLPMSFLGGCVVIQFNAFLGDP